jgi:hypothetical protein
MGLNPVSGTISWIWSCDIIGWRSQRLASASYGLREAIGFANAGLWRRAMRRHVGPSSVWTAKYVLVVLIASGISTIAGLAAQPSPTSNATASGPGGRKGVTKPFSAPRNPAESKGSHIAPMQPGSGSAPRVISKPPQLKLPPGAAATARSIVGPNSPGAVSGITPRTNNPMVLKPNTGTSGATSRMGIGLSPSSAHLTGTGISPRDTAPATIRPGAKTKAGVNGTGITRKN